MNNAVLTKSKRLALVVLDYSYELQQARQFEIRSQLIRSGTSIGANVFEAQDAESKKDFIHKLKIANKECNETLYWLSLCQECGFLPNPPQELLGLSKEVRALLVSIIKTLQSKNARA